MASFITHHFRRGQFIGLDDIIGTCSSRELQVPMESHIEHPVIHYFHSEVRAKSLPRIVFLLIETAAIVESCLDPVVHVEVCDHPDMVTLKENALAVVDELIVVLQLHRTAGNAIGSPAKDRARHERCFHRTIRRLTASGIRTQDEWTAFQAYIRAQERWERKLACISHFLGYDWEEISRDQDLGHAADSGDEA